MTSTGNVVKLQRAKQIFKNALIGLMLILAAAALVALLKNTYQSNLSQGITLPSPNLDMQEVGNPSQTSPVGQAIADFLRQLIIATFQPFLDLISYLSQRTPLAGQNPVVVKLWWLVLGLANSLFILVIILLGFQLMSASALGFAELSLRQLIPRLIFFFLLMNSSLFIVDTFIGLANALVQSLHNAFNLEGIWSFWQALGSDLEQSNLLALLLLGVFVLLSFCLLIYYILRWVVIYTGAVLAPLVCLLYLLPATRGFFSAAIKTYFYTLFILFIHGLILALGFGLLSSLNQIGGQGLLTLLIGIAVLFLLLKTPKTLAKWIKVDYGAAAFKNFGRDMTLLGQQSLEQVQRQYVARQIMKSERD